METSGGRQEIARRGQHPARPAVLDAHRPVVSASAALRRPARRRLGLYAQLNHSGAGYGWQPGFVASGLLFLALFALTFAADIAWPPRLLALGLAGLNAWCVWRTAQNLGGNMPHRPTSHW